jgi:hypothetical protein
MKKTQQYRGEAFRRAQQYLDAHQDVFGAVNSSDTRKKLDAALSKLDTAVNVQLSRVRDVRGAMQRQQVQVRELKERHMAPISLFARGQLAGVPNFAALTPSAGDLTAGRLVTAALAMATAAQPLASHFTAGAFPSNFIQQLTDAANALQASIKTRRGKLAERRNATSAVEEALKEARSAVFMVSAAVSRLVPRGTPMYDEWVGVRRIVNASVRTQQKDASVAGSITPAEPDVKQTAAA